MKTYLDYVNKEDILEQYREYDEHTNLIALSTVVVEGDLITQEVDSFEKAEQYVSISFIRDKIIKTLTGPIVPKNMLTKKYDEKKLDDYCAQNGI